MSLGGRRCSALRIQFKKSYICVYGNTYTVYVQEIDLSTARGSSTVLVPCFQRGERDTASTMCYGDLNYRLSNAQRNVCTRLIEYTGSN